ncbi:hypothetical protein COY13_04180 [Candidatus Roizmanbacteria bacterium CG_4_10_14_0_2_um_filter_36_35]|uniref:Uncharacterized protein n=4 Tax=Candidatus Roizmaniibacteriota TaxID=1752723 RepID=A0A2M7BVH7_9BACT|nr:MAG: hypothetical protein COV86_01470 [Candidatus Roizmanbacteria bacterium CG11_big_fil_rev_8_21_14_0_20_35_14]PIV10582.1 MAG: hypothetical protein COS50_04640 [Candidatus Roizmanbacteria bacterium CG03_land_8_20_14_0_80_35_26]PIZ67065.1 MAG: hypothetical protein COY13_04180 [Candidatus Roizmanbacteria bacterium CG_4_10_14_0_2_um_filter_36_35]PJC32501.1 MAG: hypothetical protein CO049_02750 [Candidatus Roizmanbacteria bacterium CG_4_9_14_0_2_um_filter_36_12]PJC80870.1 MAG: hypothetical prot
MISDKDIKKLEIVFVTKEEFKKEINDLKRTVVTKREFNRTSDEIIDSIKQVINMIGESLEDNKEQDNILDDHERRLDKVEDKVFSLT